MRLLLCKNWFASPVISPLLYTRSLYSMANTTSFPIAPQAPPNWSFTPSDISGKTNEIINNSNNFYDSMSKVESPSVGNFVEPFMKFENELGPIINQLTFLQHVSSDKEIRDASVNSSMKLDELNIDLSLRHDIFLQFARVWQDVQSKADSVERETFKYVEKSYKDYIHSGLELDEGNRLKIKEIKKKISVNSINFSKNLGEQKEYITFTKEQLEGVPDSILTQFETIKSDKDSNETLYKVTFKYPDIFPVMKLASSAQTRKQAFLADQNKVPENEAILLDTLKLRDELASLLGYDTYANYNLYDKMAKDSTTVMNFLNDLKDKLIPLGRKELQVLQDMKAEDVKKLNQGADPNYYIWDHRYYDNKYLLENFNVDLEKISEYFPLEATITGMLEIYETLFNLKFIETKDSQNKSVWHDDVKQIAVWNMDDPKSPNFVGWIYFDLHPRDGKYGHAANFGLSSSFMIDDTTRSYPVTALVCNFSKSTKDKPSLLKHNEIVTFFHELGHGIHDLVGQNKESRFNGPGSVPWDFVEAPSQMLEFWTWNKNELINLSSHYKTGEKIPESLINSLIKTKHVNGALFTLRQLHFGLFDMKVHTCKDLQNLSICDTWNQLRQDISLISNGGTLSKGYDSFGHIMSDSYSAGYYGYLWAEVFATDMYHTKFAKDPLNTKNGIQYRDIVLARGGLYDINDNLKEFLGREPSKDAFLKELGLQN
ncbi:BAK_1a_G0004960.mRNA.1.CDS.1 [Saccharomyces cerevisiae]|nr:BAK_1a_G0004960.mRNA.1.CDS.1 [Saccharomyces cerevisiae]CAI7052020.1 BAK_1a_G0004960.mRNA.1.CDS.1 [Saccharomyces cerevisiae]